jgi:hypothetical protein
MKVKIPFRMFFILSSYLEKTWKVLAYMENTGILGLFTVHKNVSELEERIYAYMEKTPRNTEDTSVNNGPT